MKLQIEEYSDGWIVYCDEWRVRYDHNDGIGADELYEVLSNLGYNVRKEEVY